MAVDVSRPGVADHSALRRWFDQVRLPWSPFLSAERQFDRLVDDGDGVPDVAAYDHLYDMADLAIRWLKDNPCPDAAAGRRFKAQMMAYRAVADTVRSTIVAEEGDAMVAQLRELRSVIDQHTDAIDVLSPVEGPLVLDVTWLQGGSTMQFRREVPRQPAGWDGVCHIEGEFATPCQVIDISMLGLGLTLHHPTPARLVGRRIAVEVPAVGDSISIQLEGRVKNAKTVGGGGVRIGIAFNRSSGSETAASTA